MKKPLFYSAVFLSLLFLGCLKKPIHPQQNSYLDDPVLDQSDFLTTSISSEKNLAFPGFDLTKPTYWKGEDITVRTSFETNCVNGSSDYWTLHDFTFKNKSLRLMYHFASDTVEL